MNANFRIAIAICLSLMLHPFLVPLSGDSPDAHTPPYTYEEASDEVLEERISSIYSDLDLRLTPEVKKYIRDYTVKYRYAAEDILARSSIYFPMFQEKLRERGLPDEIKCLAIVESNLKPDAVSSHGAVGLWQFIKSTGKLYDLDQTKYIDERRDPEKATEAAAEFLSDLYAKYGDWTLAIAAYNCGPGNVNKAMRKSGKSDFWSIRKYLPKETQNYVPKLIAIIYLNQFYYAHDLQPKTLNFDYQNTAKAYVYDGLSFKDISEASGIDVERIKELNPQYIRNYIPKHNGQYTLRLPVNELFDLASHENTDLAIISTPAATPVPLVEESVDSSGPEVAVETSRKIETLVLKKDHAIHLRRRTIRSIVAKQMPKIKPVKTQVYATMIKQAQSPAFDKEIAFHKIKRTK